MRNKILDKFTIDFINNHFEELDLEKLDWKVNEIKDAIKEIKKNDFMAGWIITEVMSWGCNKNYQKEITVENEEEHFIVKIDNRYFALDYDNIHYFYEVFPKTVIIEKIVFNSNVIHKTLFK